GAVARAERSAPPFQERIELALEHVLEARHDDARPRIARAAPGLRVASRHLRRRVELLGASGEVGEEAIERLAAPAPELDDLTLRLALEPAEAGDVHSAEPRPPPNRRRAARRRRDAMRDDVDADAQIMILSMQSVEPVLHREVRRRARAFDVERHA